MSASKAASRGLSTVVDPGPSSWDEPALKGFRHAFETVNGVRLHYVSSRFDKQDVVVLMAGFAQSWFSWRKVMPLLAERRTVIALDLPGQGDSDRPLHGYDSETVASTVQGLLNQLGIHHYSLVGHDVGAWVAYAQAARFHSGIRSLVLMDSLIPGVTMSDTLSMATDQAWRTWHFGFHSVPDLPEALLVGREREYVTWFLRRKAANPDVFTDEILDEYVRVFKKDGGVRAGLAFYRSIDLSAKQNRRFASQGRLRMPVLAIGADEGTVADMATPLLSVAESVTGVSFRHCGHFIQEEQPEALIQALDAYLN